MIKSQLRCQNKKTRNELTEELVNEYSMRIHERLYNLKEFVECSSLFTYISFASEVDTHNIIRKALMMNKQIYVPRVENKEINFYRINSFDMLIKSAYGILEPDINIHLKYAESKAFINRKIMLLPGLAFDMSGNRIGYGAGYYDRYLARYPHDEWVKIGLAYDFQITDKINADRYDVPVEYIVTPNQLIVCSK